MISTSPGASAPEGDAPDVYYWVNDPLEPRSLLKYEDGEVWLYMDKGWMAFPGALSKTRGEYFPIADVANDVPRYQAAIDLIHEELADAERYAEEREARQRKSRKLIRS